jgi:hypothetical protein
MLIQLILTNPQKYHIYKYLTFNTLKKTSLKNFIFLLFYLVVSKTCLYIWGIINVQKIIEMTAKNTRVSVNNSNTTQSKKTTVNSATVKTATAKTATAKTATAKKTTAKKTETDYQRRVLKPIQALKAHCKTIGYARDILLDLPADYVPSEVKAILTASKKDSGLYKELVNGTRKSKSGNYSPFYLLQCIHRVLKTQSK